MKIKKATEYAQLVIKSEDNERCNVAISVVLSLLNESIYLMLRRNIAGHKNMRQIIRRGNRKWKDICDIAEIEGKKYLYMEYVDMILNTIESLKAVIK